MQIRKEKLTAGEILGMACWGAIFLIGLLFLLVAIYLSAAAILSIVPKKIIAIGSLAICFLIATRMISKAKKIPSFTRTGLGSRDLSREYNYPIIPIRR